MATEPPEVQRNGFDVLVEDVLEVEPQAIESFFENQGAHPDAFDPDASFRENMANLGNYLDDAWGEVEDADKEEIEERAAE